MYPPVKSNRQFKYAWKRSKIPSRLCRRGNDLKCKIVNFLSNHLYWRGKAAGDVDPSSDVNTILDQLDAMIHLSDEEIYFKLRDLIKHKMVENESGRIGDRVKAFTDLITVQGPILDIGCADGKIVKAIGDHMNLQKEDVHGIDVYRDPHLADITFHLRDPSDEKLPFADNSFAVVTAMMSLHHIKNVEATVREVRRVLRDDGIFIIREHDASGKIGLFLDVVHGLYSISLKEEIEDKDFVRNYYAKYRSIDEWIRMMKENGFALVYRGDVRGPQRFFYASFR